MGTGRYSETFVHFTRLHCLTSPKTLLALHRQHREKPTSHLGYALLNNSISFPSLQTKTRSLWLQEDSYWRVLCPGATDVPRRIDLEFTRGFHTMWTGFRLPRNILVL